eukprot:4296465-Alexandrium_andersonii.AAC.1
MLLQSFALGAGSKPTQSPSMLWPGARIRSGESSKSFATEVFAQSSKRCGDHTGGGDRDRRGRGGVD